MAASVPRNGFAVLTQNTTTFSLHGDAAERIPLIMPPDTDRLRKQRKSLRARLLKLFNDNQGLLLICASQFFASCMNISVQMLNRLDHPIPPAEILLVRMSVTWVLTIAYMWYQGIPHFILGPPEVRALLVTRGVCGFCAVFGMYYALQYLSLSDATALSFLSPFLTSFAGTFFLGEEFSRRNLFAGLFSLLGVVLIARPEALFGPSAFAPGGSPDYSRPGAPHKRGLAVAVSMLGVFGASGAFTSLRAIGKRAHTLHCMTYFSMFTVMISATLMAVAHTEPVIPAEWKWNALLAAIFVLGFIAQFLLTTGLQRETASRGSLAMYVQIVFASILERMFFHTEPSILSMYGTAIILSSAIYVGLSKAKGEQQPRLQTERQVAFQGDLSVPPDGCTPELSGDVQWYSVHPSEERSAILENGLANPKSLLGDDVEGKPFRMVSNS